MRVANIVGQATYIILSEQVEGAEHFIVFNVKRSCGFKISLERNHRWWLDVELLWGAHLTELFVTLLSRHPGRPPRSAAVVIMGVSIVVLLLVLATVVEELRHDYKLRWWQLVRGAGAVVGADFGVDEGSLKRGPEDHNKGETKGV